MINSEILKKRTKILSIDIGKLVLELPYNIINKNYSNQITRCSSSVGANYRAACRAKSNADFIYKLKIVEEELDETMFFLELIEEFNPDKKSTIQLLWAEANELLAIFVASINTLKSKQQSSITNRKSKI
ncbi:four helix bundle protein [Parapedobacter tibetensis]|uniref:four helix bundle protein n=1 Tax=Parapedobacter tibetensis TaxID=2972951 RepID=UPI00214D7B52|nr:four helix bundle protein [Parapedobacter tibetensis]